MDSRGVVFAMAFVLGLGAFPALAAPSTKGKIQIWAVDPLVKVFRDAVLPGDSEKGAQSEVARGEHATFQIVVRSDTGIRELLARVRLDMKTGPLVPLSSRVRFVGYVPVDRPIQTPPKDQIRKPPADFPDPLLEVEKIDVKAGHAQSIWITIPVPEKTEPATYRYRLDVAGSVNGKNVSTRFPLKLRIHHATVGHSRLWVTNWFSMQWRHMDIAPKPDSPEYWALLWRYARNMVEHRQNVALISPLNLAKYRVGDDGDLEIDFSRFDRWVQVFTEAGFRGRIEGGHLGGRKSGWNSPFVVRVRRIKDGKVENTSVDPAGADADRFYGQFLPALVEHLRKKGWLDHYMQHLADEPTEKNADSYRAIANLVRKYAPELRIIEACHTKDLTGAIDVWVPQLNYLHRDFDHYRKRQKAGDEVWFYTCVFPQGEYANRFIEQPLLKTRLLHWINFRYGATGYLHWGYNHWTKDSPYEKTTRPHGGPPYLPAGDPWIVYPGRKGPIDSIRHEAMRDDIADHELLSQLGEDDPKAAMRLASKLVLDFDKYDCNVSAFRSTRRNVLELLRGKPVPDQPSGAGRER